MNVYVAGASSEIDRCEGFMKRLRVAGVTVVSTWPQVIRKVGAANPMGAPRQDRAGWAAGDLSELSAANVFCFLLPNGKVSEGALVEYGYATCFAAVAREAREAGVSGAPKFQIMVVGKETSIFTALAPHYATEDDAFDAIVALR